jgi:peroxiredoxin family protein
MKKLSLVSFSGDFDKVVATFTLATGAAAVGYEVNIFFTFWGYNAIKKSQGRAFLGTGLLAKTFNFLMGGVHHLPLSRLNFLGLSPLLMTYMMKKNNVATVRELIDAAVALRVNFYACEMSQVIMGTSNDDFIHIKEKLGVAKFLELAEGGQVLFI